MTVFLLLLLCFQQTALLHQHKTNAFQLQFQVSKHNKKKFYLHTSSSSSSSSSSTNTNTNNTNIDPLSNLATSRFPTSPQDQVRQASIAIALANKDNKTRHSIRLLLPIIGATELDDWPGGTKQMMEAASPLMNDVMQLLYRKNKKTSNNEDLSSSDDDDNDDDKLIIQESIIDESDGIRAIFTQGKEAKDDSCVVLLPSADTVSKLQQLDVEVGPKRNLIVVNSQWRRKTDFGIGGQFPSFFGNNHKIDDRIQFVEGFEPTFHCTNVMVEGNIVRVLRTYPGPWRVYLRVVLDDNDKNNIDWIEIGTKDVILTKNEEWEKNTKEENQTRDYDGGRLFDYGMPSYKDIEKMIVSRDGYVPKSLSERAASAFTFIKDSL